MNYAFLYAFTIIGTMKLSFGLLCLLTLIMMAATIVDKVWGNAAAVEWIYTSPWVVALWIATLAGSVCFIMRHRRRLNLPALLIHASFVIILAGAMITHRWGEQGQMTLAEGQQASSFTANGGEKEEPLPFTVTLDRCRIECYPGTSTPMDYASDLTVTHDGKTTQETVSMNKVLSVAGYRFYQSGMGDGYTVLSVAHDPWGIGVTYGGYLLLLVSMIAFFFSRRSGFRRLVKALGCVTILLFSSFSASATETETLPSTLQRGLAHNFGRLLVMYNGRVCPVQTLARDFCIKLYGSDSYRGLTAEQALTGWIFYYNDWKHEPMIAVKGNRIKNIIGIEGKYASLDDFYSAGRFLLDNADIGDRNIRDAVEKTALISTVCTGSAIKIYPMCLDDGSVDWISWVDDRPADISLDDWRFIIGSMEFVAREIAHGRNISANEVLTRIADRQVEVLGPGYGPGTLRYRAEIIYNRAARTLPAAITAVVCGIIAFFFFCRATASETLPPRGVTTAISIVTILLFLYLTFIITLRGIIGNQLPLGNGHETMLALAWVALLTGLILGRRISIMQPASLIIAGMAMMVAMMGEKNPQVTHLMPVLQSPLLSLHVMVIMISYSLLAFMALDSVAAMIIGLKTVAAERLATVSRVMLYPAVFFLAAGIFIGAVWANQSWGRYWGWDPKETWALITLLVYAFPLHAGSFPRFNRAGFVHKYLLVAFLSVLITYFGVNFFLSGLHSYA